MGFNLIYCDYFVFSRATSSGVLSSVFSIIPDETLDYICFQQSNPSWSHLQHVDPTCYTITPVSLVITLIFLLKELQNNMSFPNIKDKSSESFNIFVKLMYSTQPQPTPYSPNNRKSEFLMSQIHITSTAIKIAL